MSRITTDDPFLFSLASHLFSFCPSCFKMWRHGSEDDPINLPPLSPVCSPLPCFGVSHNNRQCSTLFCWISLLGCHASECNRCYSRFFSGFYFPISLLLPFFGTPSYNILFFVVWCCVSFVSHPRHPWKRGDPLSISILTYFFAVVMAQNFTPRHTFLFSHFMLCFLLFSFL